MPTSSSITKMKGLLPFHLASKVKSYNPQMLAFAIWIFSIGGLVCWLYLLYFMVAIFKMPPESEYKALAWSGNISRRLAFLTISASCLNILIKAQYTRSTLYFALFFSFLSFFISLSWLIINKLLSNNWEPIIGVMNGISYLLMVRFIQEFPSKLTSEQIRFVYTRYLTRKILSPVLSWLLKPIRVWMLLLPLVLLITYDNYRFSGLFVAICAAISLGYVYVQLRVSHSNLKNRLYWLLWLLSLMFFSTLFIMSLDVLGITLGKMGELTMKNIANLSILFAFVMIVYFSDLIDAKLLLQKTVIYGAVIFLFTFIFGIAEHYIIHQLAHYLHINDVYVASTFACVIGMCFHSLKEKLMHWMKHFDKSKVRELKIINTDTPIE